MSELPAEEPVPEPADDGNVALPVPVDSAAGAVGDGASTADTLPPSLPH
ncbi:hypothetical protein [Streptomyces sp. NPDC052225]